MDSYHEAERLVKDPDALEIFLDNLERSLKDVPVAGDMLSNVPVLISMVRSYLTHEYPLIPIGTLCGIVAALVYVALPIDLIPDTIPGIGHIDDAVVVAITMACISADV